MATIKLNRLAAETGQLPAVCLCCGKLAPHRVKNQFYLRSTGIMIAMMFLGWPWRMLLLPQAYESVTLYVPMCGTHRYRLSWHNWMMILVAIGAIIVVPLLIAGNYVESESVKSLAQMLTLVLAVGVMGAGLVFLFLWITAPRLIDYSTISVTLTSVSETFVQGVRPAAPVSLPATPSFGTLPPHLKQPLAGQTNWKLYGIIGGAVAGGLVLMLLICLGVMSFANAGRRAPVLAGKNFGPNSDVSKQMAEHEARIAQQRAEDNARTAKFEAEREAQRQRAFRSPPTMPGPPGFNTPPATTPTPNEPPALPQPPNATVPSPPVEATTPTESPVIPPAPEPSFTPPPAFTPPVTNPAATSEPSTPESNSPEVRRPEVGRPRSGPPAMTGPGFEITDVSQVKPRDRIFIFWVSRWYPGHVIETANNEIKVHYDGHADSWDAFVSLDKVRSMKPIRATTPKPEAAKPVEPAAEPVASGATRVWTDSTGQFKIEAELIAFEGGVAKLKRKDGKIISLPLEKLSASDQVAVRAAYPQP